MTEQEIRKYIKRLNNHNHKESIFIRKISKNVDLAKVWSEQPKKKSKVLEGSYSNTFFFIKNSNNEYVGAVLDMQIDLHWYILPKHRKQGYLTYAMKESILPYIFEYCRDNQRISISRNAIGSENFENSKRVATSLGFTSIDNDETKYELTSENFNWKDESIDDVNSQLTEERLKQLEQTVFYASNLLHKVSDELLMIYGNDLGLEQMKDDLKDFVYSIENLTTENSDYQLE
jgi:hypothetical protein